jgi:hypothetical protein
MDGIFLFLLLLASPLVIYWLAQLGSAAPAGAAFLALIGGFIAAMLNLEE